MKKILILLFIGFIFAQSDLGRADGQVKMQNDVMDMINIDDGLHYSLKGTFTLGTATDTSLIVFDNNSTVVDLNWEINGLVATTVLITEGGATIDSTIVKLTPINLDRNSTSTTGIDSVSSVPEDSTGIGRYGSTTLANISFGALQSADGRLLLASDSLTVFKITTDANSNKVYYNFNWIEY